MNFTRNHQWKCKKRTCCVNDGFGKRWGDILLGDWMGTATRWISVGKLNIHQYVDLERMCAFIIGLITVDTTCVIHYHAISAICCLWTDWNGFYSLRKTSCTTQGQPGFAWGWKWRKLTCYKSLKGRQGCQSLDGMNRFITKRIGKVWKRLKSFLRLKNPSVDFI